MSADPSIRRVADVDWATWQPTIRATLLFVLRGDDVLLIHKKRGIGAGKINGPGGKLDPGESPLDCAVRETREEVGITAIGVEEMGELRFQFVDGTAIHCVVFRATQHEGEPRETDEAIPFWIPVDAVPFERMWPDDRLWLPHLLAGVPFSGHCVFDGDTLLDAAVDLRPAVSDQSLDVGDGGDVGLVSEGSGPDVQRLVDAVFERPADQGLSLAMVVMHRGEVVAERYGTQPATPFSPASALDADATLISWSTAKSMTHAAVGVLVGDGLIDVDAPAPVPEWRGTDRERITLLDLLEMRPGLRFVEDYVDGEVSHCLAMLFGEGADDHAAYAAGLPLDHPPGTVWNYSSGTTNIICRILGDVVGGGRAGMEAFLAERLFAPAGMTSAVPKFDAAGTWVGSSYVYATARDFTRFGELYRNDGVGPTGARVLPPGWSTHARTFVSHDPVSHAPDSGVPGGFDYGRHWWMWPRYPGSLAAHGYEGQYVVVVPDRELVVVHLGKTPADQRHHLVRLLMAVVDAVPVAG